MEGAVKSYCQPSLCMSLKVGLYEVVRKNHKEYQFCMDNAERIQKKANKIYKMVTQNRKQISTCNSCAFHILEDGCREYIEKVLKDNREK